MTSAVAEIDAGFAEAISRRQDRLDLPVIERALEFSESAHRGQKRLSGEDYISHAAAVATLDEGVRRFGPLTSLQIRAIDILAEQCSEIKGM